MTVTYHVHYTIYMDLSPVIGANDGRADTQAPSKVVGFHSIPLGTLSCLSAPVNNLKKKDRRPMHC